MSPMHPSIHVNTAFSWRYKYPRLRNQIKFKLLCWNLMILHNLSLTPFSSLSSISSLHKCTLQLTCCSYQLQTNFPCFPIFVALTSLSITSPFLFCSSSSSPHPPFLLLLLGLNTFNNASGSFLLIQSVLQYFSSILLHS